MAKAAPSRLAGASPCWLRAVSRPIPDLSPIGYQTNLMLFAPGFVVWRPAGVLPREFAIYRTRFTPYVGLITRDAPRCTGRNFPEQQQFE